jgi:hypothetical protein
MQNYKKNSLKKNGFWRKRIIISPIKKHTYSSLANINNAAAMSIEL